VKTPDDFLLTLASTADGLALELHALDPRELAAVVRFHDADGTMTAEHFLDLPPRVIDWLYKTAKRELPPTRAEAVPVTDPGPLVTADTFVTATEAEFVRMLLEQAGVRAYLADAELVAMDWLLSNAVGQVKVRVAASDAARAAEVIDDYRRRRAGRPDDEAPPEAPACLSCGADFPEEADACPTCGWSFEEG
jgi:hypothetical protein